MVSRGYINSKIISITHSVWSCCIPANLFIWRTQPHMRLVKLGRKFSKITIKTVYGVLFNRYKTKITHITYKLFPRCFYWHPSLRTGRPYRCLVTLGLFYLDDLAWWILIVKHVQYSDPTYIYQKTIQLGHRFMIITMSRIITLDLETRENILYHIPPSTAGCPVQWFDFWCQITF